ncbi:MAG: hypothetical protein KGD72_11665, partial [Candidatus Lokiarchaeota archaeon]|nr:hypothetical protein [Candidatus Lokiarchaeota archaeon]
MKKLEVRCPSCSSRGFIEISEKAVEKAARGVYAVNISEGVACEHSFVAYIDKNLSVRDTFIADFQLELPEISSPRVKETEMSPQLESIDVNLIKLNLIASLLANIIRAIFFKRKVLVLTDQTFMIDQIQKFFDYIMENSFKASILVKSEDQYQFASYKDYIVLKNNLILQDTYDILNPKKISFERSLVRKFLEEYEPIPSIIYLHEGIQKTYQLSETILERVKNLKKKEKLISKKVIEELAKVHGVKIQLPYLD